MSLYRFWLCFVQRGMGGRAGCGANDIGVLFVNAKLLRILRLEGRGS